MNDAIECGAVIISETKLITCAHCLPEDHEMNSTTQTIRAKFFLTNSYQAKTYVFKFNEIQSFCLELVYNTVIMFKFIISLLISFSAIRSGEQIINGNKSDIGTYPWTVSINTVNFHH